MTNHVNTEFILIIKLKKQLILIPDKTIPDLLANYYLLTLSNFHVNHVFIQLGLL